MADITTHKGIVTEITPNIIKIKIEALSACASCHSHSMCTLADKEDKIIDIKTSSVKNIPQIGDTVNVAISTNKGLLATLLAYVVPAILVVFALILFMYIFNSEAIAALLALLILALYYVVLYFFREKLNNKFVFKIIE